MSRRFARRATSAYTLLEVLIALGLLAAIIAMLASMMSLFSRAEERAQRAAERLRVIRSVRTLLSRDLERIASTVARSNDSANTSHQDSVSSESADENAPFQQPITLADRMQARDQATSGTDDLPVEFVGTPLGFRCKVNMEDEPGRWLEMLVLPPQFDESNNEPLDLLESRTAAPAENRSWIESATVQWQLSPDEESSDFGQRLIRKVTIERQRLTASTATPDPNRVLDASDLYRTATETESVSDSTTVHSTSPVDMEARLIRNALFRYSDGVDWYRSWDASARQRLPAAIELTFDLGVGSTAPGDSPSNDGNGEEDANSTFQDEQESLSFASDSTSLDPFSDPLSGDEAEASLPDTTAQRETEFRLVFLVGLTPSAADGEQDQTGLEPNSFRERGGIP